MALAAFWALLQKLQGVLRVLVQEAHEIDVAALGPEHVDTGDEERKAELDPR